MPKVRVWNARLNSILPDVVLLLFTGEEVIKKYRVRFR